MIVCELSFLPMEKKQQTIRNKKPHKAEISAI